MKGLAQAITRYFRSVVAANSHSSIDFKTDTFYILHPADIISGQIDQDVSARIFLEASKSDNEGYKLQKSALNILICMKTVKSVYEAYERTQDEIEELTGQMGGEYPLSPSQREAVNHFNHMENGEILAVNGPPGTGKTTLLQSIVADLYVQKALKQEKAPLIVATSTNVFGRQARRCDGCGGFAGSIA
ncbi:AAA domain-containing protein [Brevibacillus parabrevis]|uniref:AAA domain-containing protein n=1 Tax=Brevibacillus parabrevis TaxID=54914 RepID=UPI002E2250CF|nr:AAA domain-containing protein [Brevibacillus parabrevis]MED1722041.1 AAA family ATPase [Brevibacillus parabrevis]